MPYARYSNSTAYYYGYVPLVDYIVVIDGTIKAPGIRTVAIQALGLHRGRPEDLIKTLATPIWGTRGLLLRFYDRATYVKFRRAQTNNSRSDGKGEYAYRQAWAAVHGASRPGTPLCHIVAAVDRSGWHTDCKNVRRIACLANTVDFSCNA